MYYGIKYLFVIIPLVVLLYKIIPKKYRYLLLLVVSFGFIFYNTDYKHTRSVVELLHQIITSHRLYFLGATILSIFFGAIGMEKIEQKRDLVLESANKEDKKSIKEKYKKRKKIILVSCILFNITFLFAFKYLKFFTLIANSILSFFKVNATLKAPRFKAPLGISFYTLTAISYIVDVYNNKIKPNKNIFKVALYVSFFPQIVEGPINSYNSDTETLYEGKSVSFKEFCFGYQRILYGMLKKFIIADRLNIAVKLIFSNYNNYCGLIVFFGAIAYTLMLYAEFSGTMDVVIGTGELFGVKMPENFRQPFFSKNVSEFWTRWHISLGTWFKNYIFYPVSLSKPMKKLTVNARKVLGNRFGPLISGSVALFCVWFLNGLWHGAGFPFLFFGMYHFVMILLGNIFEPTVVKVCEKLHINRNNKVYRVFQSVKMTIFIFIGELFFRANGLRAGFAMMKRIFTNFTLKPSEFMALQLDVHDYIILFVGVVVMFVVGLLKEKNINIREEISKKNIVVRWLIYYALILAIIIFGAYGTGYVPVDPIYADF